MRFSEARSWSVAITAAPVQRPTNVAWNASRNQRSSLCIQTWVNRTARGPRHPERADPGRVPASGNAGGRAGVQRMLEDMTIRVAGDWAPPEVRTIPGGHQVQ